VDNLFNALSDPTRRKILQMLRKSVLTAGEISQEFNMSKPSISHHLSILKNANLVKSEKRGQNIFYYLNMTVFQELVQWFYEFGNGSDKNEDE